MPKPFTRLCCKPQALTVTVNNDLPQTLTANNRGVLSRTDTTNVSLHVQGDVSIDGRMHIQEVLGDEFLKVSDARKKQSIEAMDEAESIRILKGLEPVSFEYKNTKAPSIGFIAQQAEQIDPTLVAQTTDGYYAMKYGSVSVHTTVAMQALLKRVEELEAKLSKSE
jgi:hypothetical protein